MKQPENSGPFTLRNAPFRQPIFTDAFVRELAEKFGLTGLPCEALADQLESAFYFFYAGSRCAAGDRRNSGGSIRPRAGAEVRREHRGTSSDFDNANRQ